MHSPSDISLTDLVDFGDVRRMTEALHRATGMPIAVVDAFDGTVLAGAGWQDICLNFHRKHPLTAERCRVSDAKIAESLASGKPYEYRCANNLWDIGIPVMVDGTHMATVFLGQFFYSDETVDEEYFRRQAREFDFDEEAYIAALRKVRRFTRQKVQDILDYNTAFAGFLSNLAENALQLRRELALHRETENQLKGRLRFIEQFISISSSPIFVKDTRGVYIECNDAFLNMIGKTREEILGKTVHEIYPKDLADVYFEKDNRLFQEPGAQVYEASITGAEGKRHHVIFHKAVFFDHEDRPAGIIGIVTPIDSLKETEQALLQAKTSAENASRLKSEFLANMSHEIRTPLSGIMGMLQLMKTCGDLDDMRQYAGLAEQAGKRLSELLADILDITRIEAGRLVLRTGSVATEGLLRSLGDIFRPACLEKGLTLDMFLDAAFPPVFLADELRLRQILSNLIGNAVKFTSTGAVNLSVSAVPGPRPGSATGIFTVRDTGVGIEESDLDFVFDSFSQVEGAFTRHHQGVGLGLAIVKRLVTMMGGAIDLRSEPGRGTTVEVALPLGLPGSDGCCDEVAGKDAPGVKRGRLRVLVVEDERINRLATTRLLEKAGHEVHQAENGQEALEKLAAEDVDLIVMDVQMPIMDGVEATRRLRDRAVFGDKADVPVIALTAYAMNGDRETFLDAGMDGYVTKPLDLTPLLRAIQEALARRATVKAQDG